jgi:hypothetical protein
VATFPLTTDFLRRMDGHNISDSAFRFYLDLLTSATTQRSPTVHELTVFVYAVLRGERTDPYPTSAIDLLTAGLLTDIYDARGQLHSFLVTDAIPLAAPTSARRRDIPDALRLAVYTRDGHACLTCGTSCDLTLDHIVPWSLGGPDTEDNLQTLCAPCNSRKGDRIRGSLAIAGGA